MGLIGSPATSINNNLRCVTCQKIDVFSILFVTMPFRTAEWYNPVEYVNLVYLYVTEKAISLFCNYGLVSLILTS